MKTFSKILKKRQGLAILKNIEVTKWNKLSSAQKRTKAGREIDNKINKISGAIDLLNWVLNNDQKT